MQYNRRAAPRVGVDLTTTWEGLLERQKGTITNISTNGCFVLSGGQVQAKELVRLEISLPLDEAVVIWAEVGDHAYDIGFGARFTSPSEDEDVRRLVKFITAALAAATTEA